MSISYPRPEWLRKGKRISPSVLKTKKLINDFRLHTVCESARCPNLSECFDSGNATFLILGDRCTRNCAFCAIDHGKPRQPDKQEGKRIARYMKELKIRFAVITSVTRDDLEDGGAGHFERVVRDLKDGLPEAKLELLVPDFKGIRAYIERVARLPVEVFAHNLETVKALYPVARQGANYERSLAVLRAASLVCRDGVLIKSGIMLGLGESEEEIIKMFQDLADCGLDILTIGQYLQPGRSNLPVQRYYEPEEFVRLKSTAQEMGIQNVVSGPYVRSSYLAELNYLKSLGKNV